MHRGKGNFRDLTASVTRLATLSQGELIRIDTVKRNSAFKTALVYTKSSK